MGRELFALFRNAVSAAEEGATSFGLPPVNEILEKASA
jgi:phosphogluconate dehydratase